MHRLATADDFDFIYGLYMHPEINPFLLYEMMDEVSFAPIFEELIADRVLYVFMQEEAPIGMFKLIPLKHRTSHIAYLGGVALHPASIGKGQAMKTFDEILAIGKSKQLRRIELSASSDNARAIRLYEKCGFQAEGLLRGYSYLKSEDRYIDELLMSYLY
jgi:putative acetyltransferase